MIIDKIYVLSAPSSKDRRDKMSKILNEMGIPFEFYISGGIPLFEYSFNLIKEHKTDKKRLNHYNEYSVTAAHLSVIKIAECEGYENILILEDDILFKKNWEEIITKKSSTLPDDFNIAYLCINNQTPHDDIKVNDDWILTRGSSLACSYIVNKKAYSKILDFYKNDYQVIDVFYYHWSYKNPCYCLFDYINIPDPDSTSSIDGQNKIFSNIDYETFRG